MTNGIWKVVRYSERWNEWVLEQFVLGTKEEAEAIAAKIGNGCEVVDGKKAFENFQKD